MHRDFWKWISRAATRAVSSRDAGTTGAARAYPRVTSREPSLGEGVLQSMTRSSCLAAAAVALALAPSITSGQTPDDEPKPDPLKGAQWQSRRQLVRRPAKRPEVELATDAPKAAAERTADFMVKLKA